MLKKLVLLGMALAAAAALGLPAAASATQLEEFGFVVPEEEELVFTGDSNFPIVIESSTLGEIQCEPLEIPGLLETNHSSVVHIRLFEAPPVFCTVNGTPNGLLTWEGGEVDSFISGSGEADFEFDVHVPNLGTCTFRAVTLFGQPFQFATGSNTIEFSEENPAELESTPIFCGEAILYGGLVLETPNGDPLELS